MATKDQLNHYRAIALQFKQEFDALEKKHDAEYEAFRGKQEALRQVLMQQLPCTYGVRMRVAVDSGKADLFVGIYTSMQNACKQVSETTLRPFQVEIYVGKSEDSWNGTIEVDAPLVKQPQEWVPR